ncbi:phosphoglycerate kinase, partial [Emiliania huxleyi CCMP1516]|uniref:Phosphoglycerate kinase n=2 Tax=Emiliania huxleyi TaxID=2903 RepID=A0A0D3ILH1_EMIH1
RLSYKKIDYTGQRVLIRVDFNVPQDPSKITNTARIDAALPTIKYALDKGAKSVVLMSHLGRPSGIGLEEKFSMKPVFEVLKTKLEAPVLFASGEMCADPAPGTVILLENLRMNIEETGKGEKDDKKIKADAAKVKKFKAHLRQLADVYINDAFGTAHRGHASMLGEGFAVRAAGSLMFKELDAFAKVIDVPARPVLA